MVDAAPVCPRWVAFRTATTTIATTATITTATATAVTTAAIIDAATDASPTFAAAVTTRCSPNVSSSGGAIAGFRRPFSGLRREVCGGRSPT